MALHPHPPPSHLSIIYSVCGPDTRGGNERFHMKEKEQNLSRPRRLFPVSATWNLIQDRHRLCGIALLTAWKDSSLTEEFHLNREQCSQICW